MLRVICVASALLLLAVGVPHKATAQSVLEKLQQAIDPAGARYRDLLNEIERADLSNLGDIHRRLLELHKQTNDSARTAEVYEKWSHKYFDLLLAFLPEVSSRTKRFDDVPSNVARVQNVDAVRHFADAASLKAKGEAILRIWEKKNVELRLADEAFRKEADQQKQAREELAEQAKRKEQAERDADVAWMNSNAAAIVAAVNDFVRQPQRTFKEVCSARHRDATEAERCFMAGGMNKQQWADQKIVHQLKLSYELFCDEANKKLAIVKRTGIDQKACFIAPAVYERLVALSRGDKPRNCDEYLRVTYTNREWDSLDKSWSILAMPRNQLKVVQGELENLLGRRLLVTQSRIDAELDDFNKKAFTLESLADMRAGVTYGQNPGHAVVVTNPKTLIFGTGGRLGERIGIVGTYRENETIPTRIGARPAAVIEAACLQTSK